MMTPEMGINKSVSSPAPEQEAAPRQKFSFWYDGVDGQPGGYIDAHSQEEAEKIHKQK